jgi:hypothetical protein
MPKIFSQDTYLIPEVKRITRAKPICSAETNRSDELAIGWSKNIFSEIHFKTLVGKLKTTDMFNKTRLNLINL